MPPGLRERAARLPLSPPPLLPRSARGRRLFVRLGIALVVVAVALGALGEFWLPGLLKAQLETRLGEVLQRDVQVAAVDISPHRLAVQIRGLQIADHPGSDQPSSAQPAAPLLAFDRLDVDLSVASIARRAPVISALRLSGLQVHLVRAADGRLSIADIVERLQALPPAPPTAEPARFSVSNIEVVDSRLRFTDHLKNSVQEVSDIRIGLPFLANFAADETTWVQPHFSARINGDPVRFDGQLKPFADIREATLQVALTGVDLTALEAYAALPAGLDLLSGRLDARLAARFSQTPDGRRQLRLSGEATLAGFALRNSASRAPSEVHLDALHLRQIDVDALGDAPLRARAELVGLRVQHRGALEPALVLPAARLAELAIDRAGRRIALAPLTLDRLQVALRRERDGSLDLANLFAPRPGAGKASATATAAPAQPAAAGLPPGRSRSPACA